MITFTVTTLAQAKRDNLIHSYFCMQAAIRAALGETSRGLATAAVVWAGAPACPPCSLACPPCECLCNGWPPIAVLLAVVISFVLGGAAARLLRPVERVSAPIRTKNLGKGQWLGDSQPVRSS